MRPLVTREEMQAADRATIEGGIEAGVLMERAGRAVAVQVVKLVGYRYGRRALVVCGRGNNGGDGYVAARLLRRLGMHATCVPVEPPPSDGPVRDHFEHLMRAGTPVAKLSRSVIGRADVIVDAIFGTGFRDSAAGDAATAIEMINDASAPCVAVDVPSGIDADSGAVNGPAVRAMVTVALAARKLGTAVGAATSYAGEVLVSDIGIDVPAGQTWLAEASDVAERLPRRAPDVHKRSAGAVAIIAGSDDLPGAAQLAARGAARAGAGYVMLGTTAGAKLSSDSLLPEVLVSEISDGRVLGPDAAQRFAPSLGSAGCVAVGPGLGADEPQRHLVEQLLEDVKVPVVVDADALNVLGGRPGPLARRTADTVITPHPGELARLLEVTTAVVQGDRVSAARRAARLFRCTVVLKGRGTIVAGSDGRAIVIEVGGPALATAGTGDVLTGVIAASVAAGLPAFDAAWVGAYLHGCAGDAASAGSDVGVVAWDVAEALPRARALLTRSGPPPVR